MTDRTKTLQDKRAFKAFALMIIIATVFIAFAGIGATVGIKGLIGVTVSLFHAVFCHCSSFTVCAGTEAANPVLSKANVFWSNLAYHLRAPEAIFFWIGLGIFGTGILKAIVKASALIHNDRRFITNISMVSLDEYTRHRAILSVLGLLKSFVLFRDDNLKYSFTHGMWEPQIYMSTGTYSYLTDKEFLSAILHEDYHRRHKDPLRLFVVTVLRELLFFLPVSSYLIRVFLDAKEKAADDNAVRVSGKPLELASAIVKLARPAQGLSHAHLANSMADMHTVEERVRRLVEPVFENTSRGALQYAPTRKTLFLSLALCAFFFGAVFANGVVALYTHKEKVTHCMSHSCTMKCSSGTGILPVGNKLK